MRVRKIVRHHIAQGRELIGVATQAVARFIKKQVQFGRAQMALQDAMKLTQDVAKSGTRDSEAIDHL